MQNNVPCAFVQFSPFQTLMHNSSTELEHSLEVRILLPLVGTFSHFIFRTSH